MVVGYPGKTVCHGGLGWSTIVLLRGHGRVAMIDTGGMGVRRLLLERLKERGLKPEDVTDLLLSHAHYDHMLNWTMVGHARIVIGSHEMNWALERALGPHAGAGALRPRVAGLENHARRGRWRGGDARHLRPRHARPHARPPLLHASRAPSYDVIYTGDAVKNRAEFLCGRTDMTYDPAVSFGLRCGNLVAVAGASGQYRHARDMIYRWS